LPEHFKATFGVTFSDDVVARAVAMLYGETRLVAKSKDDAAVKAAAAYRRSALSLDNKGLAKLKDPLLIFATNLDLEKNTLRHGPFALVEKYLGAGLRMQWSKAKGASYPDANFTLRLSYGSVRDYTSSATAKTHRYVTSLSGVIAKHKGKAPFDVPEFLRTANAAGVSKRPGFDRLINDVPVNFTCTLDTTGGNSGSAVLDDNGRLVGLLFDGTPESILSDWQYLHKEQRSIVVDVRYALYLASIQGATGLLSELGIR